MSGQVGGSAPVDPSMEDVLASIRRILSEDEKPPSEQPHAAAAAVDDEEPFSLTPEMIVAQDEPHSAEIAPARPEGGLVAPAVAAAAEHAGRLGCNAAGQASQGGGPTIEDVVREELRPLLKEWLDANLPALVERVVRSEIERVVHRSAG